MLGKRGSPVVEPPLKTVAGLDMVWGMNQPDDFSTYYADLLEGSYDCVDRIIINAYYPMGQTGGGFRTWWRVLYGSDAELDDHNLQKMAGSFARRVKAYCDTHHIPLIACEASERKHEIAAEYVPKDPEFRGLFLVLTGNAPAPIWEVQRNGEGRITNLRHKKKWPYVKHYYFHVVDPEWGHITIRMCGYPPFGAQVMLNGHEWVQGQARRCGVEIVKEGNCFIEGSDFEALEPIATQLGRVEANRQLGAVCDRWIYSSCLCFGLERVEQERTGFAYHYSVFQLELSRNLLFLRGTTMDEVYQKLIDRTRQSLDVDRLKTIFGTRHRPHHRRELTRGRRGPELGKEVQSPSYDLTVFKVRWGNLTLKIYDKSGRVLRVEVVVHNAKELKCGKVLDKLPELLDRMEGMLVRFLNTVQVAHVSFLDEGAFEQWAQPTRVGNRRLAGYDLAKLRGKGLVRRRDKSRRYESELSGLRTLCAYMLLREHVIKPLLAGASGRRVGRPLRNPSRLDERYLALQREMQQLFEFLGLVP